MIALGRLIKSRETGWTMINSLIFSPKFHPALDTWYCQIHGPDLFEEDTFVMADNAERAIEQAIEFVQSIDGRLVDLQNVRERTPYRGVTGFTPPYAATNGVR